MTNLSDNVQKALGYLRSNGINMIYISDNTDLSEDYPDGFIFIPTKDDKVATRAWVLLTNDDNEDFDEWGCSVLCDSCKNPIVDVRQNMRCIKF